MQPFGENVDIFGHGGNPDCPDLPNLPNGTNNTAGLSGFGVPGIGLPSECANLEAINSFVGCNKDGWDQGNKNVYLHTAEHFGALNSYSYFYELMPEYKEEARITDTSELVKTEGTGIPRESGGVGGGWRQSPGWIGGSIWGQKYGSRSVKDDGAIHKSQKRSLVLL